MHLSFTRRIFSSIPSVGLRDRNLTGQQSSLSKLIYHEAALQDSKGNKYKLFMRCLQNPALLTPIPDQCGDERHTTGRASSGRRGEMAGEVKSESCPSEGL